METPDILLVHWTINICTYYYALDLHIGQNLFSSYNSIIHPNLLVFQNKLFLEFYFLYFLLVQKTLTSTNHKARLL